MKTLENPLTWLGCGGRQTSASQQSKRTLAAPDPAAWLEKLSQERTRPSQQKPLNGAFDEQLVEAHAVEHFVLRILERHSSTARDFPEAQFEIESALAVCERHASALLDLLRRRGVIPEAVKAPLHHATHAEIPECTETSRTAVIRNLVTQLIALLLQCSSYEDLATAAEEAGDAEIADLCAACEREKRAIVDRLENLVERLVEERDRDLWRETVLADIQN